MKKSELKQIIREEIKSILSEGSTWNKAYDWAKSELGKSYSKIRNSGDLEKLAKKKFSWSDEIEDAIWQAWEDAEKK